MVLHTRILDVLLFLFLLFTSNILCWRGGKMFMSSCLARRLARCKWIMSFLSHLSSSNHFPMHHTLFCKAFILAKFRNQLGPHLEDMTLCVFHLSQKLHGQSYTSCRQPARTIRLVSQVYLLFSKSSLLRLEHGFKMSRGG